MVDGSFPPPPHLPKYLAHAVRGVKTARWLSGGSNTLPTVRPSSRTGPRNHVRTPPPRGESMGWTTGRGYKQRISIVYIYIYCICVIILYSIYTCRLCKFAYIIVYNIVYAVNDVLRFLLLAARVGPSRFRMPNFWDWSDSRFVSTETLFASHLLRFRDIELHVSARTVRGDFHNRTLALQTFRSFPVFA